MPLPAEDALPNFDYYYYRRRRNKIAILAQRDCPLLTMRERDSSDRGTRAREGSRRKTIGGSSLTEERSSFSLAAGNSRGAFWRAFRVAVITVSFLTQAAKSMEFLAGREHIVGGRIGSDVYLPCDVDLRLCGKIYFITWTKNSTKDWERVYLFSDAYEKSMGFLTDPDRASFTLEENSAFLRIRSLSIEDEGTYKCDVTYIQGKCPSLSYVHLYVVVEPGEPYIEVEKEPIPNGTTIGPYYESSTLLLHCKLPGGRPVPAIRWWNGTQIMPHKIGVKTNPDWTYDVTSTTRFVLSRYDLGAKFECAIENNVTRTYHSMWLKLDIYVRPRSITLRGPTTEVVAGEMVSLTCTVDGARPSANVTWYNRTDVIIPQPPSHRDLMSDGTFRTSSTLVFVASQHDHAREFFCKGTNEVLQRKHEAPLLQALKLEVLYPPSVAIKPEGVLTVSEHGTANITCSYDSNPPNITEIIWYKDKMPVSRNRKGSLGSSGGGGSSSGGGSGGGNQGATTSGGNSGQSGRRPVRKSLTFKNVTRHDAGLYSCHVRNAFGRANSSNFLQINVVFPPEVNVRITSNTVTEGIDRTVRLVCFVVHGNPSKLERVKWFFNGEPFNKSLALRSVANNNATESTDHPSSEIKLDGLERRFSGEYSCQGQNNAGWSAISPAETLTVYYPPGAAKISQREKMAVKGKTVTLECQLEEAGYPPASVYRWERDGVAVNCSAQICVTSNATQNTQGNYTCAAHNEVGTGESASYYLKIQAPPTFINQLPPFSGALRNETHVNLVCHVECDPLCEVYWMKNNEPLKDSPVFSQRSELRQENYPAATSDDPSSGNGGVGKSFLSVTSSLTWNMAQVSSVELDNSTFSCHSSGNDAGPGVQSVTLFRVEYPPENIRIPAVEILLTEGDAAEELLCTATAHPMGEYMWVAGEKVVAKGPTLFVNSSVNRNMEGRYTCVVSNRHGKAEADLQITVLHKPDCILKKEYDTQGNAILSCTASGVPSTFNFTWLKNNSTMEVIVGHGVESVSRYVVSRQDEDSFGKYSCTVTNAIGTSEVCSMEIYSMPSQAGWVQLLLQEESMIILACVVGGVAVSGILIIVTFLAVLTRRRMRAVNSCNMGERQNPEGREPSPEHAINGKSPGPITEKRDWTPLLKDEETAWTKDDLRNHHHHPMECRAIGYNDYTICQKQIR